MPELAAGLDEDGLDVRRSHVAKQSVRCRSRHEYLDIRQAAVQRTPAAIVGQRNIDDGRFIR
jgi:hypothetical protein